MRISLISRIFSDRRASVATFFAVAFVPLMIAGGAAVEYARLLDARAHLQEAVDSSVLAGVKVATAQRGGVAGAMLTASMANMKGFTGSASPIWTNNANGTFTGAVSASYVTSFLGLIGVHNVTVHVTATAGLGQSATSICLLALDPSANQSLLVNSNVTINGSACEIDVASTGNPAAIFNSGDTFNVSRICVAGASVIQNGGPVTGLSTGCSVPADPFASTLPAVTVGSCTVSNQNYSGSNFLSPGVYCGNFNFNGSGTLNLQPGFYVFSNAHWNLNSGWTVTGSGVTFYFADSNSYIQVNSGVVINASVPTSGTYANILMFEPNGLPRSSYTINGSAGHALSGLIYQPSRNITFNAQSNVTSENLTIVVNQVILDSLTWNIAPAAGFAIQPSGGGSTTASAYLSQ